jgi:hypothetical protein
MPEELSFKDETAAPPVRRLTEPSLSMSPPIDRAALTITPTERLPSIINRPSTAVFDNIKQSQAFAALAMAFLNGPKKSRTPHPA